MAVDVSEAADVSAHAADVVLPASSAPRSSPVISFHDMNRAAVTAGTSPGTVRRYLLSDLPMHSTSRARIEAALRSIGLPDLVRPGRP